MEPKEDYSHLPPEQQRRKLQAKVDELDAAVQKTLSDKSVFNNTMMFLNVSITKLQLFIYTCGFCYDIPTLP